MSTRSWLNLIAGLTRGWDPAKIEAYSKAAQHPFEALPAMTTAFQNVDAKATGLLTHASMMIAGLGLVSPLLAKNTVAEAILVFQIMVYLLIAMGCLRCLALLRSHEIVEASAQDVRRHLDQELIIRREIYAICNRVSFGFTAFVFVSLPLLWLWK
jgi:hypothetical protein